MLQDQASDDDPTTLAHTNIGQTRLKQEKLNAGKNKRNKYRLADVSVYDVHRK